MAIRRVTGAVSPSELIFADANALGATYDGSGTTIERGETFTLPAGGTTAVSNGALRLEALKGDCTITNNGNSTLTNASGVDGTIVMRSGASDFPAFVRNSSMGSMSTPAREDFTGDVSGTINSNATFPSGMVIKTYYAELTTYGSTYAQDGWRTILSLTTDVPASTSSDFILSGHLTYGVTDWGIKTRFYNTTTSTPISINTDTGIGNRIQGSWTSSAATNEANNEAYMYLCSGCGKQTNNTGVAQTFAIQA